MPPEIRPSTVSDHEKICLHILADHQEAGRGDFSVRKVAASVRDLQDNGLILVLDHDGVAVGSIGLCIHDFWYNDQEFMTDRWFWIHPEHRRGGTAMRMLHEARDLSKAAGYEFFPAATPRYEQLGKLCRFYRIAGFTPVGVWFKEGR